MLPSCRFNLLLLEPFLLPNLFVKKTTVAVAVAPGVVIVGAIYLNSCLTPPPLSPSPKGGAKGVAQRRVASPTIGATYQNALCLYPPPPQTNSLCLYPPTPKPTGGTEGVLQRLVASFGTDASALLSAFRPLPLAAAVRQLVVHALQSAVKVGLNVCLSWSRCASPGGRG
jgi:hypothetical protein